MTDTIKIVGVDVVIALYALALLGGGVMGYKKANSRISLICGGIFALLFVALLILSFLTPIFAYSAAIVEAIVLIGFFSVRLVKTKNPKVTLPVIVGGIIVIIGCVVGLKDNFIG